MRPSRFNPRKASHLHFRTTHCGKTFKFHSLTMTSFVSWSSLNGHTTIIMGHTTSPLSPLCTYSLHTLFNSNFTLNWMVVPFNFSSHLYDSCNLMCTSNQHHFSCPDPHKFAARASSPRISPALRNENYYTIGDKLLKQSVAISEDSTG